MPEFSMLQQADFDEETDALRKKLEKFYFTCNVLFGGVGVEVELEDVDYDTAFERAVGMYRQVSARSINETYGTLELKAGQSIYVLNKRIDIVSRIYRYRGLFGGASGNPGAFESFGAATANILLRGGVSPNAATVSLSTYDFMLQYQNTLERLFAREMHYTYRTETNELMLTQVPQYAEMILLKISVLKRYEELLNDHFAYNWLLPYTVSQLKIILGEKYRKFGNLPSAQGGTTVKGIELVNEGRDEAKVLLDEARKYSDGGNIPLVIRG